MVRSSYGMRGGVVTGMIRDTFHIRQYIVKPKGQVN